MASVFTYTSANKAVSAELYAPTGSPQKGLVVIAYGSDGLVDNQNGPWATMIRGYASELAAGGSVVLIPDYLKATTTSPGLSAIEALGANSATWIGAITDALLQGKALAPAGARLGLLGFSLGGFLCLCARGDAHALSSYFAPIAVPPSSNIGPAPTGSELSFAEIHQGTADPLVDVANATQILNALKAEGVATAKYEYTGAGHGFAGADPANVAARTDSKTRTLAFFGTYL